LLVTLLYVNSNETSGCITCREFIGLAEQLLAFHGIFSVVLVVTHSPYQGNVYIANFTATQTKRAVKHNTLILYKNVPHVLMHHGHPNANSALVRSH